MIFHCEKSALENDKSKNLKTRQLSLTQTHFAFTCQAFHKKSFDGVHCCLPHLNSVFSCSHVLHIKKRLRWWGNYPQSCIKSWPPALRRSWPLNVLTATLSQICLVFNSQWINSDLREADWGVNQIFNEPDCRTHQTQTVFLPLWLILSIWHFLQCLQMFLFFYYCRVSVTEGGADLKWNIYFDISLFCFMSLCRDFEITCAETTFFFNVICWFQPLSKG